MSQPPKAPIGRLPSATCSACSGECSKDSSGSCEDMAPTVACGSRPARRLRSRSAVHRPNGCWLDCSDSTESIQDPITDLRRAKEPEATNDNSLTLSTASPATTKADALVVAALQGADGPVADNAAFAAAVEAAALAGATGKPGGVTVIPGAGLGVSADRIVVVGIGKAPRGSSTETSDGALYERVRQAAGAASRALAGHGKVVSTLAAIDLTAAAEGHLLGAYVFDTYKKPGKPPVETIVLTVESAAKATKDTLARAVVTAEAVAFARSLINTAPNDLVSAEFAAPRLRRRHRAGLTAEVLDEKALAKAGYGGILGVGSGSTRPPRLVRLSYTPAKPGPRSPSSGRASPSIPAACRSSRPPRWIK